MLLLLLIASFLLEAYLLGNPAAAKELLDITKMSEEEKQKVIKKNPNRYFWMTVSTFGYIYVRTIATIWMLFVPGLQWAALSLLALSSIALMVRQQPWFYTFHRIDTVLCAIILIGAILVRI